MSYHRPMVQVWVKIQIRYHLVLELGRYTLVN